MVYDDGIYTATSLPSVPVMVIGVDVVAPRPVTVANVSVSENDVAYPWLVTQA